MQIQITGKHMDLGEALRGRIEDGLEAAVAKYFNRTGEASVFVSQHGPFVEVDCNVHLPSGIVLQSTGRADDPYAALEVSLEKMEKRVRRYKRRLKDHHASAPQPMPAVLAAEALILVSDTDDSEDAGTDGGDAPLTVAETSVQIRTMTVSEAVMQLELQDVPALMFRNAGHDGLNMVYRRPDGHIGWVDPEIAPRA
ncbi:MAG: ribosome-associated translation inhibitor RaiA [Hyphomonas sp.]|uniref:ribosome hibernation-promoting factor, HPF/YfiA family n=1 Tax=Hyphomonas sp. TaxID=87 RepID=UPI0017928F09|nr:ribosome-associated translation inhibitor RaiA [Hyphomonas sp.]MBU3920221.1 ribosome-associated translation inhibitor RaiA [Alphaproteobacteria bacterium]MBA3068870.1 ribosome-associated translation inhibitor RaiA [Hyphomonas sp.]MBU4062918.1 ribosome-associated translation inhibitor RaiA [Alphaproteobacteria bacterium]MBU4165450.1 ribosome-associated translation inhibitor RaiA [Alphaproteobacteria bacterium]MBU4568495.1 ribosome-associated translation inhibitor RaiA [Alphaproteobacteria ba